MSLGTRLRNAYRALTLDQIPALKEILSPSATSGVSVTTDTALGVSAFWNGVNVIAGTMGTLPLMVMRRNGEDREADRSHYLYPVLHSSPNRWMNACAFREAMMFNVLLFGNAYAEIEWDGAGRAMGLWPLSPKDVSPEIIEGNLFYKWIPTGKLIPAEDMIHIAGMGYDGIRGYSVLQVARESLGSAIAVQRFGGAWFGNGTWPGLVMSAPNRLSDQARKNIRESVDQMHRGPDRSHAMMIVEEGMKVEKIAISPEDSQFLETKRDNVLEVARWLNLPPHKLKDYGRATWGNIEHAEIEFVTDTLMPWIVRWEQEINRKLLGTKGDVFAEFKVQGLLRGDVKTRFDVYQIARGIGVYSVNEIRRLENLNGIGPDGDEFAPKPSPTTDTMPEPPAPSPSSDSASSRVNLAPLRELAIEAARWLVDVEAKEARKSGGKNAEKFYASHAARMRDRMGPIFRAWYTMAGRTGWEAALEEMIRREIEGAQADLAEARDIEAVVSAWEIQRPYRMAEGIEAGDAATHNVNVSVRPNISITMPEQREAPAPVVNVTTPDVTVNLPAPSVSVSVPEQRQEAPIVNVTTPTPIVNVTTPDVVVKNTINVPPPQPRDIEINRDRNGRIVGAKVE